MFFMIHCTPSSQTNYDFIYCSYNSLENKVEKQRPKDSERVKRQKKENGAEKTNRVAPRFIHYNLNVVRNRIAKEPSAQDNQYAINGTQCNRVKKDVPKRKRTLNWNLDKQHFYGEANSKKKYKDMLYHFKLDTKTSTPLKQDLKEVEEILFSEEELSVKIL
jgi:hypothetical protein